MKWIPRYLRGTVKQCLYVRNEKKLLNEYVDAYMEGGVDSRKSNSVYLITFVREAVSWKSRLQKCIALSTMKAEDIAITEG